MVNKTLVTHLRWPTVRWKEPIDTYKFTPTEIDLWDMLFLFSILWTIPFPFNLFWGVIWHKIHWLLLTFSLADSLDSKICSLSKRCSGNQPSYSQGHTLMVTFSGVTYWSFSTGSFSFCFWFWHGCNQDIF